MSKEVHVSPTSSIYWIEKPPQRVAATIYSILAIAIICSLTCGITGTLGYFPPVAGWVGWIVSATLIAGVAVRLSLLKSKPSEQSLRIEFPSSSYIEPSERSMQFKQLAEELEQGRIKIAALRQKLPTLKKNSLKEIQEKIGQFLEDFQALHLELLSDEFSPSDSEIDFLECVMKIKREIDWTGYRKRRSIIDSMQKLFEILNSEFVLHLKAKSDEKFDQLFQDYSMLFNVDFDIEGEVKRVRSDLNRICPNIYDDSFETIKEKIRSLIDTLHSLGEELMSEKFTCEEIEELERWLLSDYLEDDWEYNSSVQGEVLKYVMAVYHFGAKYKAYLLASDAKTLESHPSLKKQPLAVMVDKDWFYLPLFDFLELEGVQDRRLKLDREFNEAVTYGHSEKLFLEGSTLSQEYKVHLMPKPEYVFDTLEQVLKCLSDNPALRECISSIKVSRSSTSRTDREGRYDPVIVIYPKAGKENAQKALDGLVSGLRPIFAWGSNLVPRFNCRGKNPLIFYAQGDGAQKVILFRQQPSTFRKLYDSTGAHFNPSLGRGFPLQQPPGF